MSKPIATPMPGSPLAEFMQFARHLADESAGIIRHYFRSGYQVELKADETPVTIADRQAEERMRERIMQEYPGHGILGEEFGLHQPDAAYRWVLDPIDGTKNFIAGSYLFGTLIALLHRGRPILGVIHQPLVDDFLIGDGEGAWLNGRPVSVRPCPSIREAVLLNTDHWSVFQLHNGPAYEALSRRVKRYRTWGDCHGYFLVATGGADIMTDAVLETWDLAALVPIVQGAGGRITNWQGEDPFQGGGVVATGGAIHEEVIRRLNSKIED